MGLCGALGACAAEVSDGRELDGEETSAAASSLEVQEPGNPDFVCDFRLEMDPNDPRRFPYCADHDLADDAAPWAQYKRVIFGQHGRGGAAFNYLSWLNGARNAMDGRYDLAGDLVDADETLIIAPQFISWKEEDSQNLAPWQLDELIWWSQTGQAYNDWATGGLSSPGQAYGSYEIIDELVARVIERLPNLEEIIFTGQSAGGQVAHRYAMFSRAVFPRGVKVRFLPANPYGYTYLTEERPSPYNGGTIFTPPNPQAPHIWPDLDICPNLNGASVPANYNDYAGGLDQLPEHFMANEGTADYVRNRYLSRDVTYLVGEADVSHEEQCQETTQLLGKHRRERAQNYHAHVQELGASHNLAVIPDMGHGGKIYEQPCTREILFNIATSCDVLDNHTGGENWGNVYGVAFIQRDNETPINHEEVAVIRELFGRRHSVVLDDGSSGYAYKSVPTAAFTEGNVTSVAGGRIGNKWVLLVGREGETGPAFVLYDITYSMPSVLAQGGYGWDAESVALGDIDGDGSDELAVTRNATSGTRWYAYEYDNGSLSTLKSGGWSGSARPRGITFSDVDWDGKDELAVGNDGSSGTRLRIYDGFSGYFLRLSSVGSNWPSGDRLVGFGFETVDSDTARELIVARSSSVGSSRWLILDDKASGYAVYDEGGAELPSWVQPTALAVGRPAASSYATFAVAYNSWAPHRIEQYSLMWRDVESSWVGQVGNVEYYADDLHWNTGIYALAFGDTDGYGGDELAYGIAGNTSHKFHVVAAP